MLALLYSVAIPWLAEHIQETLRETSMTRLEAKGMAWAQVRADGRDLELRGVAPSPEDQRRALDLARGVPGVRRVQDAIRLRAVSPYRLSIDWHDGRLAVSGYMPDQTRLDALVAKIGGRTGEGAADLAVAVGSPPGWSELVTALVEAIGGLDQARAELVDARVSLRGTTTSKEARDRVLGALSGLRERGFALDLDIAATVSPSTLAPADEAATLGPAEEVATLGPVEKAATPGPAEEAATPGPAEEAAVRCQARLARLLLTPIVFESGQSRIDASSDGLLGELADTAMTCPGARIRIVGHTDNRGRPEYNLSLSRQRAQAVAARLIAAGVEGSRIDAEGRGGDRPIADNGTAEGRAKNRRIEFLVEVNR